MFDPSMTLVCTALGPVMQELAADPASTTAWSTASATLAHHGVEAEGDAELFAAIEARDAEAMNVIVSGWTAGDRLMLEHDRGVLKRALKAYRKSLKVTLLDAESSMAGGPMSAGRKSSIVGIVPPARYPAEVWNELVRQKRLIDCGRGMYELVE
jgi:hypothetical protein